jgi:prevent-host-death family protein
MTESSRTPRAGTATFQLARVGLDRRRVGCANRLGMSRPAPEPETVGSSSATVPSVPVIPQKELRNNVAEVLRRAEAGEEFTITVAGRPVAQLGPTRRRRWVSGPELAKIWDTRAPETLAEDLRQLPGELADPFV